MTKELDDEYDPIKDSMLFAEKFQKKGSQMSSDNELTEDDVNSPLPKPMPQKQHNLFSNFKKIKQIFS